MPLITDMTTHIVKVGARNQLILRIEASDGTVGWGEAGLSTREWAVKGALDHYRSHVVGQDPMRRGRIWQDLYRSQYFEGGHVFAAALSAIDIALHDLIGKMVGVPVYDLLGGPQRDYIPTFAHCPSQSGDEVLAMAAKLIEEGWEVFRILPLTEEFDATGRFEPRESVVTTAKWLRVIRETIGPYPTIGVDFHHRLSVLDAVRFCQLLPDDCLDFLEEPLRAESADAYGTLRTLTSIPFAIGEEFASKWDFAPFIERGLVQLVRLDVCTAGGFTEGMKIAGWAEAHYLDVMPHNPLGPIGTAANAHLAMAIPNLSQLEIRESPVEDLGFYDARIFPVQPQREAGRLFLPGTPGLGVEVDEARLVEASEFPSPPRLERRDGGLTNW